MPEGDNIDVSQKKLEGLKSQETEKSVADLMRQYESTFFKEVDNFQGLENTLKISAGEAKNYYSKGKGEVNSLLLRVAARGQYLVDQAAAAEAAKKAEGETKAPEAGKTAPAAPKKKAENKDNIDSLASELKSSLNKYKENLTVISGIVEKRQEAFKLLQDVWELQASPEVVNSAPNIPDSLINAIGYALNGKNGAGMCEIIKLVQDNSDKLPPEFIKECQNHFNKKNVSALMEIRITGLQQKAVYEAPFEGKMVSSFLTIKHGKAGEKPTFIWTAEGAKLPEEKQKQLLGMLGGIRIEEEEKVEAATCPKVTERFWAGKTLMEAGKFEEAKAMLEEFLRSDLVSMSYDKKLSKQKAAYEGRAKEMIAQIDQVNGEHKDFFDAQKFLDKGDIIAAKKLLLKYVAEHKPEAGKTDFIGSSKDMLKRIGLAQCADAREKFNQVHKTPPKEKIMVYRRDPGDPKGRIAEEVPNPEYARYAKYQDALAQIEKSITDGKSLDFTAAYNELAAKIPGGFDAKDEYNLLADQVTMDKGPEGLLELARKYREKGKLFGDTKYLALAEEYFMRFFGPKLQETAQKHVTIEQLRSKYYSNPTFHSEISKKEEEAKKQWDEKAGKDPEWAAKHSWNAKAARTAIENQAFAAMQTEETLKMQNSHFRMNPENVGDAGQQAVWKEFMNMKGMHGEGKWYEPFALSDEQLSQLVKELPIDIAMIAVAGAIASATAGAASGLLLEAGLSVAERQALAFGVRSGMRQFAAYGGGLLVETTAFTASHSVLAGMRTGHFSLTSMSEFREEWLQNLRIMGVLGLSGRASAALKFGKVSSFGVEMAAMGATSGHLGINDFAIVLGLKLGHKAAEVGKKAAVPKEGAVAASPKVEAPKPEPAKPEGKKPSKLVPKLALAGALMGAPVVAEAKAGKAETTYTATPESQKAAEQVAVEVRAELAGKSPAEIATYLEGINKKYEGKLQGEPHIVAELADGSAVVIREDGKLAHISKSAAETHYYSVFSEDITADMKAEGSVSENTGAFIDKEGKIHYNSKYFEKKFGVKLERRDGKNVFVKDGKAMGPVEFLGSLSPKARAEFLKTMEQLKQHEVTHRIIESGDVMSGGQLAADLIALFESNPALKAKIAERGGKMEFREIQEFLCEVSDGRVKLNKSEIDAVEAVLGTHVTGFKFDVVRKMDTKRLKFRTAEELVRSFEDAFTSRDPVLESASHKSAYDDMMRIFEKRPDLRKNQPALKKLMGEKAYTEAVEYFVARQRFEKAKSARDVMDASRAEMFASFDKVPLADRPLFEKAQALFFAALQRGEFGALELFKANSKTYAKYKTQFDLMERFYADRAHAEVLDKLGATNMDVRLKQVLIEVSGQLTPDKLSVIQRYGHDMVEIQAIIHHESRQLMSLLAKDSQKVLAEYAELIISSPEAVKPTFTPEKVAFLEANLGNPALSKELVERILLGSPDVANINGVEFSYYPDKGKPVGEGGMGVFHRIAIVEPGTFKLRFAGVKKAKPDLTLGSEATGAKHVYDVIAAEAAAGNKGAADLFAKPLGISADGTMIFYEIADFKGPDGHRTTIDFEKYMEDPNASPEKILRGLYQAAGGLVHLHAHNLVHGDFKAAQIFMTDSGGRLGDFGTLTTGTEFVSGISQKTVVYNFNGHTQYVYMGNTPFACSPFYWSGEVSDMVRAKGPAYAWKVDAYALGAEIEIMLTGNVTMKKAVPMPDGTWGPSPTEIVTLQAAPPHPPANPEAVAKLTEIYKKLKDPNNLTYTVADARKDMAPFVK